MAKRASAIWQAFLRVSLWLASAGLMLASSGLDGAYLYKLMPAGFGWLGLVLNTVSDVVSELVMYWYGRLLMDRSTTKKRLAPWLLVFQCLLVGYAWLFGWRQLLPILRGIEPDAYRWLAPLVAGFVPVGILSVAGTQALLAGRIESETVARASKPKAEPAEQKEIAGELQEAQKPEPIALPLFVCDFPGCGRTFPKQNALNAHKKAHAGRTNGHEPQEEREGVAV